MWLTLLEKAIYVPSPHNVQPWRVKIKSDRIAELYIERQRMLPREDITGSFIISAMGMFVESIEILAANYQHKLECELEDGIFDDILASRDELIKFARLNLYPDREVKPIWEEFLFLKRRTSRLNYSSIPVSARSARALSQIASKWGHQYQQIDNPKAIEKIIAKNIQALFSDLNSSDYHDEIITWFRFTTRQSQQSRDGLDYRCMNSPVIDFWLAAKAPWLLQLPLLRQLLWKKYRRQLGTIPTIGIIAGDFWQLRQAFDAGRFLIHFWLEATRQGLYFHPFGNLVTNKNAADWCLSTLKIPNIWLIFKIGTSSKPPQSYRRYVKDILI
jgi:nitroreductase